MRAKIVFLWVSPVVIAAFLVGLVTARAMQAHEQETYWNDAITARIRLLVGSEYVDEISDEKGKELFFAAMEAYLEGLDEYCRFFDPEERKSMEVDTRGQFGGVGVLVRKVETGLRIVGLRKGDPAERGGVLLEDVIVSVDGIGTAVSSLSDVTAMIRGAPGSPVRLGLTRGGKPFDVTIERSPVKVDSVVGVRMIDAEAGIGYLRVESFQDNTGDDARRALLELKKRGARAFVLDLRQNSGGVLERGAVAVADLFFKDGPIVQTRGRARSSRRVYTASEEGTLCPTEPLLVLIDGGSASAAEVVAGAFQDRRRAILLGERTFGKFLVQSIHRLPEEEVAFQITTARYYTPYGRWLQRRQKEGIRGGLLPDVVVARDPDDTLPLYRDVFSREHGLDMVVIEEEPVEFIDVQLDRAVSLLRDYEKVVGEAK